MIKAANTLIQNAFSLREHLRTLIHQADRKHQPRTQVEITVFGPDDRRAIRMEMRKCRVGNP